MIAVFPEGTTHDIPRLAPIRTGAARIALGAKAHGVRDIQIVPVGLWFEDKVALRSRVLVRAGEPLDLDHELWSILPAGAEASDEDHESVRALTGEITERLRAVSPDFDTFLDGAAFSWAADIALREGMRRPQESVPLATREPLAARLAKSDPDERRHLTGSLGRYSLALDALGVTDEELVPRPTPTSLFKRALWLAVGVVLLAPFAIAGVLINAVPAVLVLVAGLAVKSPVTKGTMRILVAIVVFPLTWLAVSWFDVGGAVIPEALAAFTFPLSPLIELVFDGRSGFWASLLVFVTAPLFGLSAIWILEWVVGLVRLARGWYAVYAASRAARRGHDPARRPRRGRARGRRGSRREVHVGLGEPFLHLIVDLARLTDVHDVVRAGPPCILRAMRGWSTVRFSPNDSASHFTIGLSSTKVRARLKRMPTDTAS